MDDVLARLDKDTHKKFIMSNEIKREYIPTASFGLNTILGGGLARGQQSTFWGDYSTGKTAFLLQTIGINQRRGLSAALIDAENTFDPKWASRLGVEPMPIYRTATISDTTDELVKLIHAGVDIVLVDSISTLIPKSFYEKTGEMKSFANTGQMGQQARDLGTMSNMLQGENFETAVIFISQVRMDLGGFIATQKPSGGKQMGHAHSLLVKLISSKSDKQAIKGQVQRGEFLIEESIGRKVKWEINKNKINGRYGIGEFDLITQGPRVGLRVGAELLDYAVLYGVAEQKGAWFVVNGERFQGRDKAVEYIETHPGIQEFLESEITNKLTVSGEPVSHPDE